MRKSITSTALYALLRFIIPDYAMTFGSFMGLVEIFSGVPKNMILRMSSTDTLPDTKTTNHVSLPWWKLTKLEGASSMAKLCPDFPILSAHSPSQGVGHVKRLIYLDSAATSHKPICVTDKITKYYHSINSNVHRGTHYLSREATSEYEISRDIIAKFVNSNSRNEIVFTSGATEAINLVAASYGRSIIKHSDEILISELEHHSNIVPWQILAEEKGAVLNFVPVNKEAGCLDIDAYEALLTNKTKIVSLQHISNVLGCINPIEKIVSLARSKSGKDVKIVLDACQSVPHMNVDVQKLGVDFMVASGHKMCGPTGIGFLWGREDLLNKMPPYMGGGEMINDVFVTHSTFSQAPARFEAGTPAIAQAIGLGAAIEYLNEVGMDRIESFEHELTDYMLRRLSEVEGIHVFGPKCGVPRGALASFICDNIHASDLGAFLDIEGVAIRAGHHCCQPLHRAMGNCHSARASLHFYNTKEDIDVFIEKLRETIQFLGGISGDIDSKDHFQYVEI